MRKRASLLRELRQSLIAEGLRGGMTPKHAETYATYEILRNADTLAVNRNLRLAVRGCRL